MAPFDVTITRISPSDQAALDDIYRQLKELEGRIPIPESSARVLVGVFNARTGVFSWRIPVKRLTTTVPGKGTIVVITGQASINAVNVSLVFGVQDREGDFTVTVDGTTISAPAGQTAVTVDIGRAPEINFIVSSGNVSFSGELTIERFAAGAGAFTIDAMPIGLVYCPLQGVSRQNLISYQRTEWAGTKIGIIRTQGDSEVLIEMDNIQEFAQGAQKVGGSVGGTIGLAISAIGTLLSGLGSVETRFANELQTTTDHEVENKQISGELLTTPPGAGPGQGAEIFLVLQHVKAAWLADNGNLSIAILGTPELGTYPTSVLQSDLAALVARGAAPDTPGDSTHIMLQTLRALLQLNPFVSPPNIPLPPPPALRPPRFRPVDGAATRRFVGPTNETVFFTASVQTEDQRAVTQTQSQITDLRKGFLHFLGSGPSEDKTISWKTSLTNLTRRTTGVEITTQYLVRLQQGEKVGVTGYYDSIFGTIAFEPADRPPPPGSE